MAAPIDSDLLELQTLLASVFRALHRRGPDLGEVESLKRSFIDAGLGMRHGRVLLAIAAAGPLGVKELAHRVALAPATTSLLVGELDRAGFVVRTEDETDHRRTIVSLPPHLQAPLEEFAATRLEPLRRTLEGLDPATRAGFLAGLRALEAELAGSESVKSA